MVADEKKFLLKYLLAWYLHWNFLMVDCLYSLSMASDNFLETKIYLFVNGSYKLPHIFHS